MITVRERPPIRLTVNVETPSGAYARWAADDPTPQNQPQQLTFSTSMPGGFNDMSCTLQRDPSISWPDLEELSGVTVHGPGGQVAWQGRLEQLPDTGGAQAQVSPQCVGYQSHLDDNGSAAMIYVDRDLTRWTDPSYTRQVTLVNGNDSLAATQVAADPTNNSPALVQSITDSWSSPWVPICESWYDAGSENLIAEIYYDLLLDSGTGGVANFMESVSLSIDANASTTEGSGNLNSVSEVKGYFSPATAYRFGILEHAYGLTNSGAAGVVHNAYWHNLAVYGNHGLTGYGPDPVGFLASEIIAHAVGTWAPLLAYTTGANGTIQPSSFIIPQLVFLNPTTASTIIKQAAQYELLDWAIWEGPTFYANPRGQSVKTRNWRARVGPAQLQQTGLNVSRIWNGVIVQFTNVDGTTGTVGPPGSGAGTTSSQLVDTDPTNPANQAGINRWTLLSMQTTTPAAAIQVGQIFLQEQKLVDTSGQASIVGHVQDGSGVWWPAWMIRAGDTITFIDSSNTSPRRVVSTSYDDSSKTNQIQLDQPPDALDALLERLSAVIQPLGLS